MGILGSTIVMMLANLETDEIIMRAIGLKRSDMRSTCIDGRNDDFASVLGIFGLFGMVGIFSIR